MLRRRITLICADYSSELVQCRMTMFRRGETHSSLAVQDRRDPCRITPLRPFLFVPLIIHRSRPPGLLIRLRRLVVLQDAPNEPRQFARDRHVYHVVVFAVRLLHSAAATLR
jgi:hypothetical protein